MIDYILDEIDKLYDELDYDSEEQACSAYGVFSYRYGIPENYHSIVSNILEKLKILMEKMIKLVNELRKLKEICPEENSIKKIIKENKNVIEDIEDSVNQLLFVPVCYYDERYSKIEGILKNACFLDATFIKRLWERLTEDIKDILKIPMHEDSESMFALFSETNEELKKIFSELNELEKQYDFKFEKNCECEYTLTYDMIVHFGEIINWLKALRKFFFNGDRAELKAHISRILKDKEIGTLHLDILQVFRLLEGEIVEDQRSEQEKENYFKLEQLISQKDTSEYQEMLNDLADYRKEYFESLNQALFVYPKEIIEICQNLSEDRFHNNLAEVEKVELAEVIGAALTKSLSRKNDSNSYFEYCEQMEKIYFLQNLMDYYELREFVDEDKENKKKNREEIDSITKQNEEMRAYIQTYRLKQKKWNWYNIIGSYVVRQTFGDYINLNFQK